MFDDNFSFATRSGSLDSSISSSSQSPSSAGDLSRSVSPCSPITAYPPPQFTMTDLASCLGRSRLRADAQICYDACDAYAGNPDDDAGWQLDPPPTSSSSYGSSSSRPTSSSAPRPSARSSNHRARRQSNSRLLCSTSHHRDIAALVARMVDCQEQCSIAAPGPASAARRHDDGGDDDDEGYDSCGFFDPDPSHRSAAVGAAPQRRPRLEYRRSMELKASIGGGACVSKSIRLRKDRVHKRKA